MRPWLRKQRQESVLEVQCFSELVASQVQGMQQCTKGKCQKLIGWCVN